MIKYLWKLSFRNNRSFLILQPGWYKHLEIHHTTMWCKRDNPQQKHRDKENLGRRNSHSSSKKLKKKNRLRSVQSREKTNRSRLTSRALHVSSSLRHLLSAKPVIPFTALIAARNYLDINAYTAESTSSPRAKSIYTLRTSWEAQYSSVTDRDAIRNSNMN